MKRRAALSIFLIWSASVASKPTDVFDRYCTPVISAHARPLLLDGYRDFPTATRRAMRAGVNFGGYLTLVEIGCGAGCIAGWFVNRRTGRTIDAPVSGEDFPLLHYETRAYSRLLRTEWLVDPGLNSSNGCLRQDFLWNDGKFNALNRVHRAACEFDEHKL